MSKTYFMKKIIIALFLMLATCSMLSAQKSITFDNHTNYTFVLPAQASQYQTLAVDQLSYYWGHLSYTTDIADENHYKGKHAIFIGRSKFTEKLYQKYGDQIKDDGFLLHTDGKNLYIIGHSEKSEFYGACHLLENYFDVAFTGDGGAFFFSQPKQRTLCLHDLQNPSFQYRETLHYYPNKLPGYADWHKLHNREDFNKNWGMFVHTFQHLIPVSQYFDTHPEWFSQINGQRIRDGQLCLSNPEVLATLCAHLAKRMAAEPEKQIWSVSQNDNELSCTCPHCCHLDSLYGGPSGTMIHFINQVAERFQDKTISTLAYQQTRRPPKNIVPAKNVNIMFCSIECQRQIPIADNPADAGFQRDMEGWTKLTDNILLWDYVVQFRNYMDPFPNLHVLQPNLQNFHNHGIRQMFEQGSNSNITENFEWRTYLIAHLLWDVNVNVDSLRERFLIAHYGANRAPFIQQYMDTMKAALLRSGQMLNIYGYPINAKDGYLSPSQMQYYRSLFKKAWEQMPFDGDTLRPDMEATLVEVQSPELYNLKLYNDRLRLLELTLDFATLELSMSDLSPELSYFTTSADGQKRVRPEMIKMADDFVRDCHRLGVERLDEITYTPEQLRSNIDNYIKKSTQPNLAQGKTITCSTTWSNIYDVGGPKALVDGNYGIMNYNFNWLGFQGADMDVVIDLDSIQDIHQISMDFLFYPLSWIFVPKRVTCWVSDDQQNWTEVGSNTYENEELLAVCKIIGYNFDNLQHRGRYIRVKAESLLTNPAWHRGVGQPCWIFCDEIIVR